MKIIGVTGPSGAGKTCLLEYLGLKGAEVINADRLYHELLKSNISMRNAVRLRFGTLDTKELGRQVFSDRQAMRDLEGITHPFVTEALKGRLDGLRDRSAGAAVIEAIALFESGIADLCDGVIFITAGRERLIDRITARDGVSREYAEARLNSREFSREARFVICNDGDLSSLYSQADKIYKEIMT
ncbi:MAG: dephospho-CoA kinase [Oscillospiraceae bacterium]|nr:dephospho-CoA kinase [Oscillospiraceae bacterium]